MAADCSELSKLMTQIAMNIGSRKGMDNIDRILAEMKKDFPLLTREFLTDAITEATAGQIKEADALTKKLNVIKREARTDNATRRRIIELQNYIDTGTFQPSTKKKNSATEAIIKLQEVRDALRKELSKTEAAQEQRRKTREPKIIEGLQSRISELENFINTGTLPPRVKKRVITASEAVNELRTKRDELKKEIAQSEPAKIQRIKDSIAELERRIKTGDIFPKTKVSVVESKELERLKFDRDRLQRRIRMEINALKPKSVWEHTAEPFNAARAIITSADLSATLRQGGFIAFAHPVRAAKVIPDMLRALLSEKETIRINEEIIARPNAPLYAKSKLFIAPIDGSERLSRMEEAFMSKWIDKIPFIRASGRAYVTFLNLLRADSFDTMAATLSADGSVTRKEADAIAGFVNVATGRGDLGALERAAVPLNTAFFAPRYVASRFQLLLGKPLWGGTKETRKLIAKEYGRYLMGLSMVYALGLLAGGDIEDDPRSPDFGKIRFGRTRLDLFSGMAQIITFSARIISGKTKSSTTEKITPIRGEDVPFGGSDAFDVTTRFLRGKLSPFFGTFADVATGENVIGEKVTPYSTVRNLVVPLSVRDVYESMLDQGIASGSALSVLAIFGAGLQTYGPKDLLLYDSEFYDEYIKMKQMKDSGVRHKYTFILNKTFKRIEKIRESSMSKEKADKMVADSIDKAMKIIDKGARQ